MSNRSILWIIPAAILVLSPLIAYAAFAVTDRWYRGYELLQQEQALRDEVQALQRENVRLQEQLRYARSDQAIEAAAREQLNLIKPGDKAIVLVGPAAIAPEPALGGRIDGPRPPGR
ncbi:MAG: septum formation initiator family protein [Chloroflexota bacterium]